MFSSLLDMFGSRSSMFNKTTAFLSAVPVHPAVENFQRKMQWGRIQFLTARKAETPFGIGSSRHCKIGSILLFCFAYAYINSGEWADLSGNMTVHDIQSAWRCRAVSPWVLTIYKALHVFSHPARLIGGRKSLRESHVMSLCTYTRNRCQKKQQERDACSDLINILI